MKFCDKKEKMAAAASIQLYDTPAAQRLLVGLSLAAVPPENETNEKKVLSGSTDEIEPPSVSERMQCSSCGITFTERTEQMDHYKTDWHRFNLKHKLRGLTPVSEEKFEEIAGGDLSSISGSDTESDSDDNSAEKSASRGSPGMVDDDESYHVEGIGRRHPKVFFHNHQGELLALYRCVLYGKKNQPSSQKELIDMAAGMPSRMKWAIIMAAGGHFAAAIFEGENVIVHKTFHRYVVRAKRGTAQSTRDKQGNAPKSGGASIRRYNESALNQEIQELLESWSAHLKACDRIFLRAPSFNRAIFFGGKTPLLDKNDDRIRQVPFATRRPTNKEVQKVHASLALIDCFGTEAKITDHVKASPKKVAVVAPQRPAKVDVVPASVEDSEQDKLIVDCDLLGVDQVVDFSELREFESTKKPRRRKKKTEQQQKSDPENRKTEETKVDPMQFDEHQYRVRNELFTACKTGDIDLLKQRLAEMQLQSSGSAEGHTEVIDPTQDTSSAACCSSSLVEGNILNVPFGDNQKTLLHIVAIEGCNEAISLLLRMGADPTIRDRHGQTPYVAATRRETRNEFRRFMGEHPNMYDYMQAEIPGPLDEDKEAERKMKEAEKKKAQRKARKEKLKDKKAEEVKKTAEDKEQQRFLQLSDREKRALAAEKRLTDQLSNQGQAIPVLSRCFQCAADITGKIPFEYNDYKFCTTKCLKEHRAKTYST